MKTFCIGDMVKDDEGNLGIVLIKYNNGDICFKENDELHLNPFVVDSWPVSNKFPPYFTRPAGIFSERRNK